MILYRFLRFSMEMVDVGIDMRISLFRRCLCTGFEIFAVGDPSVFGLYSQPFACASAFWPFQTRDSTE